MSKTVDGVDTALLIVGAIAAAQYLDRKKQQEGEIPEDRRRFLSPSRPYGFEASLNATDPILVGHGIVLVLLAAASGRLLARCSAQDVETVTG